MVIASEPAASRPTASNRVEAKWRQHQAASEPGGIRTWLNPDRGGIQTGHIYTTSCPRWRAMTIIQTGQWPNLATVLPGSGQRSGFKPPMSNLRNVQPERCPTRTMPKQNSKRAVSKPSSDRTRTAPKSGIDPPGSTLTNPAEPHDTVTCHRSPRQGRSLRPVAPIPRLAPPKPL